MGEFSRELPHVMTRAEIQAVLDERERQDHFRLKRFAARRAERLEVGEGAS